MKSFDLKCDKNQPNSFNTLIPSMKLNFSSQFPNHPTVYHTQTKQILFKFQTKNSKFQVLETHKIEVQCLGFNKSIHKFQTKFKLSVERLGIKFLQQK